jgi:hypothetical protein
MTKPNNRFFTLLLSPIFFIISTNLFGQELNSYKFIEPNISISYDSNIYKIANRYSNTTYETESYDFEFKLDTVNKSSIYIKADHPIVFPPKKTQDSLMLLGLEEIKAMENDSFAIVSFDKVVRDVNGFSCLGFVGYDKTNKQYATIISCYHFSENDNTEIKYMSVNKNDLDEDYGLLKGFLSGFKTYNKTAITKEEKFIKNKYTIIVLPTKIVVENFKYRPKTYLGIVKTKQKLEHAIKEVQLINNWGAEIFAAEPNGTVPIICNDKQKGKIAKKGMLVLLNSFGKKVKIPFTFSYVNNKK